MVLNYTPLYRSLRSRVKVFSYLEMEDLMLILVLAALLGLIGNFIPRKLFGWLDVNLFLQYIVPAIAIPFVMLFKYGKPRGYFRDLLVYHTRPHIYSPGARDRQHARPYFKDAVEGSEE